jgi:acyl-CoA hydrolase
MSDGQNGDGRLLTQAELRGLEERERERMAHPEYRRTLQDPGAVIEALIEHHSNR